MLLSCCLIALLCNLNRKGRMNTCVLSLYPEIMKWLCYINQMRPECCFHCCCCDYLCESMYLTYLMYLTSTSIDATNHSPCPVGATAEWLSWVLSAPTKETWTASLLSAHLKHFLLPSNKAICLRSSASFRWEIVFRGHNRSTRSVYAYWFLYYISGQK